MDEKVIKIPISYSQRKKNQKGEGYVPCEVSGRYLNFHMTSSIFDRGEFITVDIMTENSVDMADKKITSLIITREDLLEVLNNIKPREEQQIL